MSLKQQCNKPEIRANLDHDLEFIYGTRNHKQFETSLLRHVEHYSPKGSKAVVDPNEGKLIQ